MNFEWKGAALYGIFTAIALVLFWVFISFISERVQIISWTLLIAGLAGSSGLLIYLLLRWYGARTLDRLGAPLEKAVEKLRGRHLAAKSENRSLGVDDMRAAGADIGEALLGLRHYAGMIISTMMLMAVVLEIVALATAAVMYLQAQRISEQNELLLAQNRAQDAAFLNEGLTSIRIINQTINTANRIAQQIENDFLSPFDIVQEFVGQMTQGAVSMAGYAPQVCEGEEEICDEFSIDRFLAIDGDIILTDQNAPAMRGYFRLADASEHTAHTFFASLGNPATTLQEDIATGAELIAESRSVCGFTDEERLSNLWSGISGIGLASIEMWPVDDALELKPGYSLSFLVESDDASPIDSFVNQGLVNIGIFVSSIGILDQTVGDGDGEVEGPNAAAKLLVLAMKEFKNGLEMALVACNNERQALTEQAAALRERRNSITRQLLIASD